MLRNMVTSLILQERIITTVEKARYIRPFAERMVTLGKRGGEAADVLHARRQAAAFLKGPEAVKKLFDTVSPRFGQRSGGYTRMTRLGFRKGDGAQIAMVEFIGSTLKKKKKEEKGKKKEQPATPETSAKEEKKKE